MKDNVKKASRSISNDDVKQGGLLPFKLASALRVRGYDVYCIQMIYRIKKELQTKKSEKYQ